jgi:glycosyltransferase involved in cell wall biosynthesis
MIKKVPALSIFFPFWNEEKNIKKVVKNAIIVACKIAEKWEIIMVDDGSSDRTVKIAQKLAATDSRLRLIRHDPNRGYGAALKEGLSNSRYDLIVFTDGDGQFDFSEVSKFLGKIDNADMVIGYRGKRRDHPLRHFLMILLKIWDLILFGFYFKDIDCGFKMFKKESLRLIMPLMSEGAMITTEILAKAKKANLKINQVKVTHYPRLYGDQSGGNFRVIWRAIKESLSLWRELNFNYGRT